MTNALFSTYRTGENRVTSSTIAVFERIDLALVQELLGAATGMGSELLAVAFENQAHGGDTVPDAKISARFEWYFETKTEVGAYAHEGHGRKQLRGHSRLLNGPQSLLFVITPDQVYPAWFDELDGVDEMVRGRVLWLSFRDLVEKINGLIGDPTRVLGEQTRFLLSELTALYEEDGLLSADDTVIVAARAAWPEYQEIGAYVCQADRSFRDGLTHFGFYADGAVQDLIPRIREHYVSVRFSHEEARVYRTRGEVEIAEIIDRLLRNGTRFEDEAYDVLLLTGPDDPQTVKLAAPIVNDMVTESGRPWGWTLNQRYTSLDKLKSGATLTSQL